MRVELNEFSINARNLVVPANQPVRLVLRNTGRFPHSLNVTGHEQEFVSERVDPGKTVTWDVTISTPGIYQTWCPVGNGRHWDLGMTGTLNAVEEGQEAVLHVPVIMDDFSFQPIIASTVAGQTVRFDFVNVGQRPHDMVIAGRGDVRESGRVEPGTRASWSVTLQTPGTYEFFCSVGNGSHKRNGMEGALEVLPSGS